MKRKKPSYATLARTVRRLKAEVQRLKSERNCLQTEYESRAIWIEQMCRILGYDNADGFHSSPDPFEIAIQLRADNDRLQSWVDRVMQEQEDAAGRKIQAGAYTEEVLTQTL